MCVNALLKTDCIQYTLTMKNVLITLAVLFLICGCNWRTKTPVVYINEELSAANLAHAESKGFKNAYIAYEWTIDRNHDGIFDCLAGGRPDQCAQFLLTVPTDKAIVITLDWESQSMEDVKAGKTEAIDQWLAALNYFKLQRPLAKIGFYGIPSTRYYHRDAAAWAKEAANYEKILEAVDYYMPSLYDFYPDGRVANHTEQDDLDFVKWNIEQVLTLPAKPTLVYIWHRYHSNGLGDENSTLIPAREFINFANAASAVRVEDKKIDGFIWWGADLGMLQPWGAGPATDIILTAECGPMRDGWPECLNNLHRFIIDEQLMKLKF